MSTRHSISIQTVDLNGAVTRQPPHLRVGPISGRKPQRIERRVLYGRLRLQTKAFTEHRQIYSGDRSPGSKCPLFPVQLEPARERVSTTIRARGASVQPRFARKRLLFDEGDGDDDDGSSAFWRRELCCAGARLHTTHD